MNTENMSQNNEASTGSARPSSVQKDDIEITSDTQWYMRRHGWTLAGSTTDQTVLGEVKWSYQEAGCAVAFTWEKEGGNVIYWIHDGHSKQP
jgi:hypothetical protein